MVVFNFTTSIDEDRDVTWVLPLDANGTVQIRLQDTEHPEGPSGFNDTVSVDQLWLRVVP